MPGMKYAFLVKNPVVLNILVRETGLCVPHDFSMKTGSWGLKRSNKKSNQVKQNYSTTDKDALNNDFQMNVPFNVISATVSFQIMQLHYLMILV